MQYLKYGWAVALAGVVITGATIFTVHVIDNERKRIMAKDIIQVLQREIECSLAVGLTPLVSVGTYNVGGTNYVLTNAVGYRPSHKMMVQIQNRAKVLLPYYVNTNTLSGYTNIQNWTVTGAFKMYGIGDGTNFTRLPGWTNPPVTNWLVCYTSYYPRNDGGVTVICYTADSQQVVSYATNWAGSSNWQWGFLSNWPQIIVTSTNAATYGDAVLYEFPSRIFELYLREIYRVLALCTMIKKDAGWSNPDAQANDWSAIHGEETNFPSAQSAWDDMKNGIGIIWTSNVTKATNLSSPCAISYGSLDDWGYWAEPPPPYAWVTNWVITHGTATRRFAYARVTGLNTQVITNAIFYIGGKKTSSSYLEVIYDDNGDGVLEGAPSLFANVPVNTNGIVSILIGNTNNPIPTWNAPDIELMEYYYGGTSWRGYETDKAIWLITPNFSYCTDTIQ